MLWEVLGKALTTSSVVLTIVFLVISSWIMAFIINRMALMCRSVYVVFVPYGILVVSSLVYITGYIDYKGLVVMALFYLFSYPGIWYINYEFSRDLAAILKEKQVTHETTGQRIWAEEYRWVRQIKRYVRRLTGKNKLNDEMVNWILDNRGTNGYHVRHYYRPETLKRDG